ncbi:lysophospholipid acyltransferase family protein [Amphritea sp. HPY]|uniref:lysophospholipid acyltransferase family protein n=1 Tax=Amphritea sp. HPY TaxID=3421652 RepID=UPI003D7EAB80
MGNKETSWSDFLAPKYWFIWLFIGILRVLALLPFKTGLWVGKQLGNLLYFAVPKRRRVTEVNIALCFPELSAEQQQTMVREVFHNNGIGLVETGWAYWGNKDFFRGITHFKGFGILDDALANNNGVILMGGHYSPLDLCGLLFSFYDVPCSTLYRKHNNPLLEWFFCKGRSRFSKPLERSKTRQMLRDMRKNHCIWYAPDQDLGSKGSVFVPFFGQTAATITATTKMSALNNSPLVVLGCSRNLDNSGYTLEIRQVEGFPSGDETTDAALINKAIEGCVRTAPSQYMWVHKRFKTQPDGNQKLYQIHNC